jgi:hypothetical protein
MKSTCKLNSLVVATGLQSPGPRIDSGSARPPPQDSLRLQREREREREASLPGAGGCSLCVLFAVSVFFCGVVAACLRASSSPAQISHQRQQVRGPTLLPTSKIFTISASLWGFGLFCSMFLFFCIFFDNHLR